MHETPTPLRHVVSWTVPHDHPALPGHFPGQPIVPGVVVLSQVLEAAAGAIDPSWVSQPLVVAAAKFLAPLRPGDACSIVLTADAAHAVRWRFEVQRGPTVAASGVIEARVAAEG
jgi:3-hydroxyacyl-[acyl-carrier-protein] dehydratase